jgi:hypothetical protein
VNSDDDEMKSPPKGKSSDGRGNPKGISYFYTASNKETAISEVRPYKNSQVTVATFKSQKNFSLIDFRAIRIHDSDSCYPLPLSLTERYFLDIILENLKKTILEENNIDYIPLQYIIEYLKTKGKDGIIYESVVGEDVNILFFSDKEFELVEKKVYTITKVDYKFEELT